MASTAPTEKITERQRQFAADMARIDALPKRGDGLRKLCAWLVKQPNFRFIEMGEGA